MLEKQLSTRRDAVDFFFSKVGNARLFGYKDSIHPR
jgi:hypothetical protein